MVLQEEEREPGSGKRLQSLQWKILTQSLNRPLVTLILIKWIWWNTAQLYTTLLRNWIPLLKSALKPLLSKYWQFTSVNCIQTSPRQEWTEETRQDGSPQIWFIFRVGPVCKSSLVSFVACQGSNVASLAVSYWWKVTLTKRLQGQCPWNLALAIAWASEKIAFILGIRKKILKRPVFFSFAFNSRSYSFKTEFKQE